mgnify:CR=1 FL=1
MRCAPSSDSSKTIQVHSPACTAVSSTFSFVRFPFIGQSAAAAASKKPTRTFALWLLTQPAPLHSYRMTPPCVEMSLASYKQSAVRCCLNTAYSSSSAFVCLLTHTHTHTHTQHLPLTHFSPPPQIQHPRHPLVRPFTGAWLRPATQLPAAAPALQHQLRCGFVPCVWWLGLKHMHLVWKCDGCDGLAHPRPAPGRCQQHLRVFGTAGLAANSQSCCVHLPTIVCLPALQPCRSARRPGPSVFFAFLIVTAWLRA